MKKLGYSGSAWDHAKQTSAPKGVVAHERAHSKNTLDPSRGPAPDSGQTKGGGPRKKGSGAE